VSRKSYDLCIIILPLEITTLGYTPFLEEPTNRITGFLPSTQPCLMKFAGPFCAGAGNTPLTETQRAEIGMGQKWAPIGLQELSFCSIESFMCRSILGVNSLICTLVMDLVRGKKNITMKTIYILSSWESFCGVSSKKLRSQKKQQGQV